MQVGKWGNSLAVRLPAAVVEALQLREGDEVQVEVADGSVKNLGRYAASWIAGWPKRPSSTAALT